MTSDNAQAIAQVYAEALFGLALEQQLTETLGMDLERLAGLIKANPTFAVFLESPAITRAQKTASISRIFTDKMCPLTLDFLKVLAVRGRLNLICDIQECFVRLEDKQAGRERGTLVTAIELSDKEFNRLTEQIKRTLNKELILENRVDKSILGGMILKVEDTVLDASLGRNLEKLAQALYQRG